MLMNVKYLAECLMLQRICGSSLSSSAESFAKTTHAVMSQINLEWRGVPPNAEQSFDEVNNRMIERGGMLSKS